MRSHCFIHARVWSLIVLAVWVILTRSQVVAADPKPSSPKVAERPWAAAWISSIARVLADCDVIYDSIDRPDLAESIEERQTSYREFQGIDRTRPLGMMWIWDDVSDPSAVMFFPIQQVDELMKTVTLNGVVDYHKVNDNQYEIERPGAPYHVVLRSGYALLGEDVPCLNALRNAPERITKESKDNYDVVLMLDQRQVPRGAKQAWTKTIRSQIEPWLQPIDQEPAESAVVRRAIGKAVLDLIEVALMDLQSVTMGARIDPKTHQLQMDLILQAEQSSSMAGGLNRLVVRRSEFSALVNRDASAGLAINWPLTVLGKELPGVKGNDAKGERLDAGVQVIGSDWGDITVIGGIRGVEAVALNAAVPFWLSWMEQSKEFTTVSRNIGAYRDVTLHKIVPARVPESLREYMHPQFEILVGQGKDTIWATAGGPMTLSERLQAAIDAVEETPASQRTGAIMQGRLSVGKWPKVVPLVDPVATKEALEMSRDGFSLTVQPVPNGLKVQFVAEEGLLRVIGRHWARQVEMAGGAQ